MYLETLTKLVCHRHTVNRHTWTTLSVAGLCGIATATFAPVCGRGVTANASADATPARHTARRPLRPAAVNYVSGARQYH